MRLAHLVFNVFGGYLVICLFKPVTMGVSWFVEDIMKTADPAVAVSFENCLLFILLLIYAMC